MKTASILIGLVLCLGTFAGCAPKTDAEGPSAKASAQAESNGTSDGVGKVTKSTPATSGAPGGKANPESVAPVVAGETSSTSTTQAPSPSVTPTPKAR